jgi:hypothetical protein
MLVIQGRSICCNLSLGLVIEARAYKVEGQEWAWESHFMIPRVQKSVREWTLTLPSELPFWELKSQWTPEFGLSNFQRPIAGIKSHWIETFLISLESSWNVNVWNGLAWPIWTPETPYMAKRRANLTPDH